MPARKAHLFGEVRPMLVSSPDWKGRAKGTG